MSLVGIFLWLVHVSAQLIFVKGSLSVFCSYRSAEVIHAGLGMVAWPSWCSYLSNSGFHRKSEKQALLRLVNLGRILLVMM